MASLDRGDLFSNFQGNTPVSATDVARFEEEIGLSLPKKYTDFLKIFNGGEGFIGQNAYIILWRLGELVEMNKAYQVAKYAPGLFLFGSDGGGEAFAFDARTSAKPIVSVPFVGMELSLASMIAPTFEVFLEKLSKV